MKLVRENKTNYFVLFVAFILFTSVVGVVGAAEVKHNSDLAKERVLELQKQGVVHHEDIAKKSAMEKETFRHKIVDLNEELDVSANLDSSTIICGKTPTGEIHIKDLGKDHKLRDLKIRYSDLQGLDGVSEGIVKVTHFNDAGVPDAVWIQQIRNDGGYAYFEDIPFSEVIIGGFIGTYTITGAVNYQNSQTFGLGTSFDADSVNYMGAYVYPIYIEMSPYDVPTEGLVGFWSFDEGTGTVVNDISGNGNGASINNASAQLNDFNKSVNVSIYGGSEEQINAQIPFDLYRTAGMTNGNDIYLGENLNVDFSDIRFTSENDEKYDYWIESISSNHALVWVEIPTIPAYPDTFNVTIQFDNPNATSESNGEDTFEYFDNAGNNSWVKLGNVIEPDTGYNVAIENIVLYENDSQVLDTNDSVFKMWYRLYNDVSGNTALGYAESYDGTIWEKHDPVLITGEQMWCPYVFRINETTLGLYVHAGWDYFDFYTSSDGINWTKVKDNALTVGSSGAWDDDALGNINIWIEDESDWRMIYEAMGDGTHWYLGYATSIDGLNWTKYGSNPISTELGMCGGAEIHKINDKYYMWYHYSSSSNLPTDIGRAYSTDLITWTKEGGTFFRTESYDGFGNSEGQVADPCIVEVNDKLYMFYDTVVDQLYPPNECTALAVCNMNFTEIVNTTEDNDTSTDWQDEWDYGGGTYSLTRDKGYYNYYALTTTNAYLSSKYNVNDSLHFRTKSKFMARNNGGGALIGFRNYTTNDWAQIMYWNDAPTSDFRINDGSASSSMDSGSDNNVNIYDLNEINSGITYSKNDVTVGTLTSGLYNDPMPINIESIHQNSILVDWMFVGKSLLVDFNNTSYSGDVYEEPTYEYSNESILYGSCWTDSKYNYGIISSNVSHPVVSIPYNENFNFSNITLIMFINPNEFGGVGTTLTSNLFSKPNSILLQYNDLGSLRSHIFVDDSYRLSMSPNGVVKLNEFQMVSMTYNCVTHTLKGQINGVDVSSTVLPSGLNTYYPNNPENVDIVINGAGTECMRGVFDNAIIYNRELSEVELKQIYYDSIRDLQLKTNSNAGYTSKIDGYTEYIDIPYDDTDADITSYTAHVPETVEIGGVTVRDYPRTVTPFSVTAEVGYTEDTTLIEETLTDDLYEIYIGYTPNNNYATGSVSYTADANPILNSEYLEYSFTSNQAGSTLTYNSNTRKFTVNGVNFVEGQTYNYKITCALNPVIIPHLPEIYGFGDSKIEVHSASLNETHIIAAVYDSFPKDNSSIFGNWANALAIAMLAPFSLAAITIILILKRGV